MPLGCFLGIGGDSKEKAGQKGEEGKVEEKRGNGKCGNSTSDYQCVLKIITLDSMLNICS